jgi:hypothetical protein
LLTPQQYEVACTATGRTLYRLAALGTGGLRSYFHAGRLLHRLSKLAYQKHHHQLFRDERSDQAIERLRQEINQLRA